MLTLLFTERALPTLKFPLIETSVVNTFPLAVPPPPPPDPSPKVPSYLAKLIMGGE